MRNNGDSSKHTCCGSHLYLLTFIYICIHLLPTAHTVSVGQIAYFQGNCPQGWEEYLHAKGKFILGLNSSYPMGSTGGEAYHVLTLEEMPSHTHTYYSIQLPGNSGWSHQSAGTWRHSNYESLRTSSSSGQNKAHINLPPYIVLRPCKRVSEDMNDLSSYYTKSEADSIFAKKNQITGLMENVSIARIDLALIERQTAEMSQRYDSLQTKANNLDIELSTSQYVKRQQYDKVIDRLMALENIKNTLLALSITGLVAGVLSIFLVVYLYFRYKNDQNNQNNN